MKKNEYLEAKNYLKKIGASQDHYGNGSVGKLHELSVKSKIHHQAYISATNYHENYNFDVYLAQIIKERFSELSQLATEKMYKDVLECMITEEGALEEKLRAIKLAKEELERMNIDKEEKDL